MAVYINNHKEVKARWIIAFPGPLVNAHPAQRSNDRMGAQDAEKNTQVIEEKDIWNLKSVMGNPATLHPPLVDREACPRENHFLSIRYDRRGRVLRTCSYGEFAFDEAPDLLSKALAVSSFRAGLESFPAT